MNSVIIALGSNINPEENIQKTKKLLSEKFKLITSSKFIVTKPLIYTQQADFLNGSVLIETSFTLEQLREELKQIEIKLGRVHTANKCGPRTIDLDITVWNGEVVDKDFYERDFLKNSVLELLPNLKY